MSRIKKKILQHLAHDVYCRLGVSTVHGIGVFAIRSIPEGIDPLGSLVEAEEIKFDKSELKELPKSVREQIKMFCYYRKNEVYISSMGMNTMNFAVYINHSKTPNLRMKRSGAFETLRVIHKGEELFMDYDDSFGEEHIFDE
jgi:SET domain-containing protein